MVWPFIIAGVIGGLVPLLGGIAWDLVRRRLAAPGEVVRLSQQCAESSRRAAAVASVLTSQLAYTYRLEQHLLELREEILACHFELDLSHQMATFRALIESRPNVSSLLDAIRARDWHRFAELHAGLVIGRTKVRPS